MSTGVQTAVGQIVWHTLMTPDVEKAKSFYGDLLGWDFELFMPGEHEVPVIVQNGQRHGGIRPIEHEGTPPHWFGYVQVDDLDATLRRAESGGGKTLVPPTPIPDVGTFGIVADPQGAVIAAFKPAGEMPASSGTFLWNELLATDVDAAKGYYGEVFGWTTSEMQGSFGTYTLFRRAGDVDVAGAMRKPDDAPGPAAWLVYLATDDVDATVARTKELGGAALMEAFDVPEVGRLAVLADPAGAVFGVFKPNE